MDLALFHPKDRPTANLKGIDRRNRREGYLVVHIYELTGYYNMSKSYRLLGHYRLYMLFKKKNAKYIEDMNPARAYILQYQASHGLKYLFARFSAWVHIFFGRGYTERNVEIQTINRQLIHEGANVLQQFLIDSEQDFESAFHEAMKQIEDQRFPYIQLPQAVPQIFVQINEEHQHHNNFSKNEFHVHPTVEKQTNQSHKGKEEGVFSKKQLLILFDLLAQSGKIEHIGWHKQKKLEATAELMQALTGKGKESWQKELQRHRERDLYAFTTDGEKQELINTLTNLAEKFRAAGFRKVAELADKKMLEIERHR